MRRPRCRQGSPTLLGSDSPRNSRSGTPPRTRPTPLRYSGGRNPYWRLVSSAYRRGCSGPRRLWSWPPGSGQCLLPRPEDICGRYRRTSWQRLRGYYRAKSEKDGGASVRQAPYANHSSPAVFRHHRHNDGYWVLAADISKLPRCRRRHVPVGCVLSPVRVPHHVEQVVAIRFGTGQRPVVMRLYTGTEWP